MRWFLIGFLSILLLVGCDTDDPTPAPTTDNGAAVQAETPEAVEAVVANTPIPPTATPLPTATPIPLAATVNNDPIFLADYNAKLEQYQQWFPNGPPQGGDMRKWVLDILIDERLIQQEAARQNIAVDAAVVEAKIAEAIEAVGGEEAYAVWLDNSGLTDASYRQEQSAELLTQAVIAHITQDVPTTLEKIRARYIQVDDLALAETVLAEINAGADFATLVRLHSVEPTKDVTNGDLGFFGRDTLLVPAVEEAAFGLEPFQVSSIIAVVQEDGSETYFIVQTTERDPERLLLANERADLATETFETWLQTVRDSAEINVVLPLDR